MKRSLSILGQQKDSSKELDIPEVHAKNFRGKAAVVTLGCAKNQVDSEVMLGAFRRAGYEVVSEVEDADIAVVNTCGFLESAVRESIDCILDISELKAAGRLKRLVVSGCMVERYCEDLPAQLPEVDAFLTTDQLLSVEAAAQNGFTQILDQAARPYFLYDDSTPRVISGNQHSAYVKISEGCNRPCSFCIIPRIRGEMRCRSVASVVREIDQLAQQGVREVNLVAQDLTAFRSPEGEDLSFLLNEIDKNTSIDWVRLLYAYPLGINQQLLDSIVKLPSVCSYLDFPLQHSSERILRAMKRPLGKYTPRKMVEFIKAHAPEIRMRTTFIVGFPGETEQDIDDLEEFIRESDFTSVGIFEYSREQGTPSAELEEQVPESVKSERRERLMLVQQEIVQARLQEWVGKTVKVLVDGVHQETDLLMVGRSEFQAPDVDGVVIMNDKPDELELRPGQFVEVLITEALGYDLVGEVIREIACSRIASSSDIQPTINLQSPPNLV